ncbi:hypothetical protein KM427_20540 [Nocardioides sp. LMS-CY]|uniref:COG1470 family protein n=1 Tax=Nocardioides sp. (strain LMS-CY) TaxID=2840457 RepID=UPI001C002B78|nr:hypothetical protein [Nocardioides sp. LMS-CY]QWF21304.1 hypothetical protein KM427_20540 [Nocardioides sp. LMS-CY]
MTSSFPGHEPAPGVVVSSRLRTAAGSPLPVEVTLTNTASTARVIAVGAIGVDSSWLPPMTRTELLEPGQSVVVTLTLSPAIGTVPAQYPLAFTAQSLDPISGRPGGAPPAMVDSVLVVNPRNQLEIELVPRRVSLVSSRRVRMTMRNTGDDVARVKVGVQASPRLRVRFKREDVEVLPGATEQVKGRVSVPRPRFFGTIAHHAYTVTARGTESVRHVEGSVTQRPFVNTFVLKAVALLAVVSVWIAAAVIFIPGLADRLGDRQSETTTTAGRGERRRLGVLGLRRLRRRWLRRIGRPGRPGRGRWRRQGRRCAAGRGDRRPAAVADRHGRRRRPGRRPGASGADVPRRRGRPGWRRRRRPELPAREHRHEPRVVVPQPGARPDAGGPDRDHDEGRLLVVRGREVARLLPADLQQARLPVAVVRRGLVERERRRAARGRAEAPARASSPAP